MALSYDNSVYTTIQHWEPHLDYIQYCELYLHYVHIFNIRCIHSIYLNVFQCLLLHVNFAHANMLVIYIFSFKYVLYFCVLYFVCRETRKFSISLPGVNYVYMTI